MLKQNTVILNKYRIIKQIGKGGMSTIYLAADINLNKYWTVKEIIVTGRTINDRVNLESLLAEANLIKKLDHPSIPRIVDIIKSGDTVFIVRDYIDGEPMDQVIKNFGEQPQASVVEWAKQLCDVLDYLHNRTPKIIYRDMKPANIMLVSDGSLRLIDFGIAQEIGASKLSDKQCIGTRGFAPPEQFERGRIPDERADIYALGKTLYQLATGISPASAASFGNKQVCEVNSRCTPQFSAIVDKCTQLNPDDRYQNCSELHYALNKLGTDYKEKGKGTRKLLSTLPFVLPALSVTAWCVAALGLIFPESTVVASPIAAFFGTATMIGFEEWRINKLRRGDGNSSAPGIIKGKTKNIIVPDVNEGSLFNTIHSVNRPSDFETNADGNDALSQLLNTYGVSECFDDQPSTEQNIQSYSGSGFNNNNNSDFNGNIKIAEIHQIQKPRTQMAPVTPPQAFQNDVTEIIRESDLPPARDNYRTEIITEPPNAAQNDVTEIISQSDLPHARDNYRTEIITEPPNAAQNDVTEIIDNNSFSLSSEDNATELISDDAYEDYRAKILNKDCDDAVIYSEEPDSPKSKFKIVMNETVVHSDETIPL